MNDTTQIDRWPLGEMEIDLSELRSFIGMMSALAGSSDTTEDQWIVLQAHMAELHDKLDGRWQAAFEQRKVEHKAHEAALAAAKARAAPRSAAEVDRVASAWRVLDGIGEWLKSETTKALARGVPEKGSAPDSPA